MNQGTEPNVHAPTVAGFGEEWRRFDQSALPQEERGRIFDDYFSFLGDRAPGRDARVADYGCGSGRWAAELAGRVRRIVAVDASAGALSVARRNLAGLGNVEFREGDLGSVADTLRGLDFAYSLGVLHHLPDPLRALRAIRGSLAPGGGFLLYIYYRFDDRPAWYRALWGATDLARRVLCRAPFPVRRLACDLLAFCVYWPLARGARVMECARLPLSRHWPLAYYRDKSVYTLRTDALDRFGTALEQRFTREETRTLLERAGFTEIEFSPGPPFWTVFARRPEENA